MSSGACVASPMLNRPSAMQEMMHAVHPIPALPHPFPPSSPGRTVTRPRRQSEHEQTGVGLLRPQVVYEHTSEDVLLQVLQEDNPYPIPAVFDRSISNLTLRLNLKKNWYKSEDCLFYGGRQLLEQNQRVRDVVDLANASNDQRYLHVFVKAEDLRSVTVTSQSKPAHRTSALSQALSKRSHSERSLSERSLSERSLQSSTDEVVEHLMSPLEHRTAIRETLDYERAPHPVPAKDDVIHLIIRKTAHVSWQHVGTGQFELTVSVSDTAAMVKERLASANGLLADKHALLYNGFQLDSNKPLSEYGVSKGAVLELVPLEPAESMALAHPGGPRSYSDGSPMLSSPHHSLFMQWQRANSGLRAGHMPALASSGSGGSYLMRDAQNQVVAVFKPVDEEPNAANNPRGYSNTQSDYGMRLGILPGEGAFREVAAYVLDHDHHAGVPATAMVYAEMPEDGVLKYGSLQAFVAADCDCEEMGTSAFPVEEVHKIAILDCRLGNTDRNASNILARKEDGTWRLFPIDHGYCLPATLEDITFEWSYWPQAQQPFSEESRKYIAALDADYDLALLRERQIPLRPACARIFRATTLVLKLAAARGHSPYDVAMILQRPADDSPSPLEKLHEQACRMSLPAEDDEDDLAPHSSKEIVPFRHRVLSSKDPDDATYISHLKGLVEAYLEKGMLEGV